MNLNKLSVCFVRNFRAPLRLISLQTRSINHIDYRKEIIEHAIDLDPLYIDDNELPKPKINDRFVRVYGRESQTLTDTARIMYTAQGVPF